jgi:hypothetical protein
MRRYNLLLRLNLSCFLTTEYISEAIASIRIKNLRRKGLQIKDLPVGKCCVRAKIRSKKISESVWLKGEIILGHHGFKNFIHNSQKASYGSGTEVLGFDIKNKMGVKKC